MLDLPPRRQPQAIGGTNGLPKYPLAEGILVADCLEIGRAEKLFSPGIWR